MARTYQPTLRLLLRQVAVFIARWRVLILAGMTPEQATALATFELGLRNLQEQLGTDPTEP